MKGMEVDTGIITEVKAGKGEGEREEPAGKSTITGIHHVVMKENMMGITEEKEVDMKVLGGLLVNITSSLSVHRIFVSDFPNKKQVKWVACDTVDISMCTKMYMSSIAPILVLVLDGVVMVSTTVLSYDPTRVKKKNVFLNFSCMCITSFF